MAEDALDYVTVRAVYTTPLLEGQMEDSQQVEDEYWKVRWTHEMSTRVVQQGPDGEADGLVLAQAGLCS